MNQEYSVIIFSCTNYSSAGHSSIRYKPGLLCRSEVLIHERPCCHPNGNSRMHASSLAGRTMAVISGRSTQFFKSQVGSGSKSHDLFGDLIIISLISASEVGQKISSIFPLNIISVSLEIFGVLFQMVVVFFMKYLLNLSARS